MADLPLDIQFIESPLFPRSNKDRASYWLKLKEIPGRFERNVEWKGGLFIVIVVALIFELISGSTKPIDGLSVLLLMSDFSILQVAGDIYEKSKLKVSLPFVHSWTSG